MGKENGMVRTEFGYERTSSASINDVLNCVFLPGYIIPADLKRMSGKENEEEIIAWAQDNLLASPGATLLVDGEIVKVPTLVPARNEKGNCKFFTKDQHCCIHENAPFGCAFFSAQMTENDANDISMKGLMSVVEDWSYGRIYSKVWKALYDAGKVSPPPAESRKLLKLFAIYT
jgi:hypothetical protein